MNRSIVPGTQLLPVMNGHAVLVSYQRTRKAPGIHHRPKDYLFAVLIIDDQNCNTWVGPRLQPAKN